MNYAYKNFVHGQRCTCLINGIAIKNAKISIDEGGAVYICQDTVNGNPACDKLGYNYSWELVDRNQDFEEGETEVFQLRLIPSKDYRKKIL